jgi:hypothetical protein
VFSIHFSNNDGCDVLGPYERVQIDGKLLIDGAGKVIAVHSAGQWRVGGSAYLRFDIHSTVRLRLADDSYRRTVGPVGSVQVIGGAIRTNESLGHLNETANAWLTFDDQGRWSSIVIESM